MLKNVFFLLQATWLVHRSLMQKLREMPWKVGMTMLDFYERYYVPFGELLTDMERYPIVVLVFRF